MREYRIMSAAELKNRIQTFLDHADERVLNIVNGVFENYYKDEQVAFHPDGTPMTRKEYKMALDIAEEQIKNDEYISADQLEKEEK